MIASRVAIWLVSCLLIAFGSFASAEDAPSVAVQTETPRSGALPDLITAYGSAAPALDANMSLSVQQNGRVLAITVTPGETVRAGERLLDFGASPAAVATYQQAVTALSVAKTERAHVAQLLAQQLATRDQLAQADKAVADAEAALNALRREEGDRSTQTLTAPFDGIVASIPVAQGDRVQAGGTLLTLTRLDGLVVTVGIDPSDRNHVRPGQQAHLVPLGPGREFDGRVLRVDGVLDPKTRLIDADIAVPPGSVISGTAYRADITVGRLEGWIVPHDAVLTDNKGAYVFQVAGKTASRVNVTVAGSAGSKDVIQGPIDPRHLLVVEGNYELSDHAMVRAGGTP